MTEKVRINLSVDEGVPEALERLAGGRNKMGDYLSKMIFNLAADESTAVELSAMDNEGLRLMVQGLGGRMRALEGELMQLRAQLAAVIAGRASQQC